MQTKRILGALLCAALILTLAPVTALAADGYAYIDANGNLLNTGTTTVTVLFGTGTGETLASGWYIVLDSGVTRSSAITISGDVHLILADGALLMVTSAGDDEPGIRVEDASSLTIYGQTWNSGSLIANGGYRAAGIGGGYGKSCGTVTINGGIVTANGVHGAGIGGGFNGNGGIVNISGGTVTAKGIEESAGIGGGYFGDGGTVYISGGTVIAIGGEKGAGIGGGYFGDGAVVDISGGTVTATGGEECPGIGGGYSGEARTVDISGGTVTATGGDHGAGIGGGSYSSGGTITISGGMVTATGGSSGSGIGSGVSENGGTVYISGGSVKATGGGTGAEAIGHGYLGTDSGTLQNNSDDKTPVYLTSVTLEDSSGVSVGEVSISALTTGCAYGINDIRTDSAGKLYLYLPEGSHTTAAQITGQAWPPFSGDVETTASGVSGTLTPLIVVTDIEKTSSSGSVDMYTITYSDGSTSDFVITNGADGKSPYELAVENGYSGTLEQWLASLAGAAGANGSEIELQTNGSYIQWRYSDETEWCNLMALSNITGAGGSDGADSADGLNGTNGANGIGISGIEKTATNGNVDTYTIAFTNGTKTTFTVTNGRDGAGIVSGAVNEKGELVFTLTDGTTMNLGQVAAITDSVPAGGTALSGQNNTPVLITVAFAIAVAALLGNLGWLIPLLRKRKSLQAYRIK